MTGKSLHHVCTYTNSFCFFRNDYYGGQWASFSLYNLQQLPDTQHFKLDDKNQCDNIKEFNYFGNNSFEIENFSFKLHIPE